MEPSRPWRNSSVLGGGAEPPLSEQGETIIGVYLLLLGWLSWFGNTVVLFVLVRQRSSLQPTDLLTFNLAVSDASISVFGYSRGIIQIFNVFQDSGFIISSIWTCEVDGFLTLIFGLSSINTLTVISITRYIKGCQPSRAALISRSSVSVCLLLIWTTAGFWSGAPLLGWGSYTDRGYGTCEIDWSKAASSGVYRSYIISIFIFCFFIPVFIMLFCYISIINTVKRGNALAADGHLSHRQRTMERDVTVVSTVICTAFILAWSPYAVVSMWSACGFQVPSLTSIFTRLFAKSASFYNPLIYFGLSSKFRRDASLLLPCAGGTGGTRDAGGPQRFQPQAAGHGCGHARGRGHGHGRAAASARARLKAHLTHTDRKYSPVMEPPAPGAQPGGSSPPRTPPPASNQLFHITVAPPTDPSSESECERL